MKIKIAIALLAVLAIAGGVFVYFSRQSGKDAMFSVPPAPMGDWRQIWLFNPEDVQKSENFGYQKDGILPGSDGEPALLTDYVHTQKFARQGDPQVVILKSIEPGEVEAGNKLIIKGQVNNPEDYPLVDLTLWGMIFREPKNMYIQDYFVIKPDFSLKGKGSMEFEYSVDTGMLAGGEYKLAVNVNQGMQHFANLQYNHPSERWYVPNSIKDFKVIGGSNDVAIEGAIRIKDGQSEIKGGSPINPPKELKISSSKINVSFTLVNQKPEDQEVDVAYYPVGFTVGDEFLDMLDPEWSKNVTHQSVQIKAGETKDVSFDIDLTESLAKIRDYEKEKGYFWADNGRSFTSLVIKAKTSDTSSVAFVPMFLEYLNYIACPLFSPQITKFPVAKGESFDAMFATWDYRLVAFATNADQREKGKVELILYDDEEQEIGKAVYDGNFSGLPKAWKKTLTAQRDLNYIKAVLVIYDQGGNPYKRFERIYDCNELGDGQCLKKAPVRFNYFLSGFAILLLMLLMILLSGRKNTGHKI